MDVIAPIDACRGALDNRHIVAAFMECLADVVARNTPVQHTNQVLLTFLVREWTCATAGVTCLVGVLACACVCLRVFLRRSHGALFLDHPVRVVIVYTATWSSFHLPPKATKTINRSCNFKAFN